MYRCLKQVMLAAAWQTVVMTAAARVTVQSGQKCNERVSIANMAKHNTQNIPYCGNAEIQPPASPLS